MESMSIYFIGDMDSSNLDKKSLLGGLSSRIREKLVTIKDDDPNCSDFSKSLNLYCTKLRGTSPKNTIIDTKTVNSGLEDDFTQNLILCHGIASTSRVDHFL